jgi:hypothetical protein
MCSVTAMRPAQTQAIPDNPRPTLLLSRAFNALTALTLRIPIPLRRWSAATAPDGDSSAFPLVRGCVEPPAGIEPATPSLPFVWSLSYIGASTGQRDLSDRE